MHPTASRKFVIISAIAACAVLASIGSWWLSREPSTLRVWFADVGQGDGIIIRTPSRQTIVVDGGPSANFLQEVDSHVPVTDRNIDLVVATHADSDHIAGLTGLVASGRVRSMLTIPDDKQTKTYTRLQAAIASAQVPVEEARAGKRFTFGDVTLDVLWPTTAGLEEFQESNDRSIVLKLSFGASDILLTGDMPEAVEAELMMHGQEALDVEVLKVGHHGSNSSTRPAFLQATSPELAVISVGAKNRYGHPAARVLRDLEAAGARVIRTDMVGDILVTCTVHVCSSE